MKRRDLALVALALASAGAYVLAAAARGSVGFALDDAWIHQVYARNLGEHGEFSFFAGQLSAGSTSPLWALLLAVGYALHLDFHFWTYLWGALLLGGSAALAARLADQWADRFSIPGVPHLSILVALFLIFEWHLAWSAVSGMEIPLFVLLSLVLLERSGSSRPRGWLIGLLAGLLTLARPEGLVFAALVVVGLLVQGQTGDPMAEKRPNAAESKSLLGLLIQWAIGFAVVVAPYLLFNLAVSGTILPNTFYAKNAEYAILFQRAPFVVRWLQLLAVPWVGAQLLLLPGAIFIAYSLIRRREWPALVPFVWVIALPALYALRLPVDYQHGRYLMPVVPFILLYGLWGTALILQRIRNWTVRTTWVASIAAVLIAFWLLGANAYATDVAIIDCETVGTAHWVSANIPDNTLIAAHDIGALEYYYPHPFIDLAGLVSPEVIPFIRDQGRVRDFLFARGASYAVIFPDWYPALSSDPRFVRVHQTDCAATRAAGSTNLAVYRIAQ